MFDGLCLYSGISWSQCLNENSIEKLQEAPSPILGQTDMLETPNLACKGRPVATLFYVAMTVHLLMDYIIAHEQCVHFPVLCRFSDGLMSFFFFFALFLFAGLPYASTLMPRAVYSKSGLRLAEGAGWPITCHFLDIPHKRHHSGCGTWSKNMISSFAIDAGCRRDWASFMVEFGSVVAILLTCIFRTCLRCACSERVKIFL